MRVLVLLSDDLVEGRIAGRSVADHWAFLGGLVGVAPERARPDAAASGPLVVVDGRYAALRAETVRAGLAAGAVSADGDVVIAVLAGASDAPLADRSKSARSEAPVRLSATESLRFDRSPGEVEAAVRRAWLDHLAARGARFVDPARTLVDTTVEVAPGAVVWPDAVLRGTTRIAGTAEIQQGAWLDDTSVGDRALVRPYTVCGGAVIGPDAQVGPFAHLRKGAVLEADTKVGNFVEVKQATLRRGAKASHLTYLGDAEVGADANIGAGTITCNYDGFGKYRTAIGPGAFVGSNSSLVAPVSIGAGAIIGAGSVVTRDVPAEALFVERAVPKLFEGQAPLLRERNKKRAESKK